MRIVFALIIALGCAGMIVHTQVTQGPFTLVGGGSWHLPSGMIVTADHMTVKGDPALPAPSVESALFQGNVTITQDRTVVKADEAKYNPTTHQLELSGSVRVVVPEEK